MIEKLLADQIFLIDSRFKELDASADGKQSARAALKQLRDVSELEIALLGTVRQGTEPEDG